MNERIVQIRQVLGLNQTQFSEKLGLTSANISSIERRKSKLTEQSIYLICLTFGVNEKWLRTGDGEMFKSGHIPGEDELIEAFRQLSPAGCRMTLEYLHVILKNELEMRGKESPPEKGEEEAFYATKAR